MSGSSGAAARPRPGAPRVAAVYELAARAATAIPDELRLEPGATTTLRDALGPLAASS